MNLAALILWLRIQAPLWVLGIPALVLWLTPTTRSWLVPGFELVLGLSYLVLWLVLGAGRKPADWVTLTRFLALLAMVHLVLLHGGITWIRWTLLIGIVCSDLLDGYVARRFGGSPAGAVLDMETDQITTLCLSLLLHQVYGLGAWVFLLPAYRYLYVLFLQSQGLPAHDPKPRDGDNSIARFICGAMMVLLLLAAMPTLPPWTRSLAAGTALVMLTWSFGTDAVFLVRRGRAGD